MQISKIALACTLACAAMSASAASTGIPAVPAHLLYMSGASGVDSFLGSAASSLMTVTSYAHSSDNNYRAWYGTALSGAIPNVAAGTPILFVKRSKGGSAFGVGPLAREQRIATLDWANAGCTADATAGQYTCPVVGSDPGTVGYANDATNPGHVPDFGVSDVEPAMFSGINTENGTTALLASEAATLAPNVHPWAQLAEGVAVTKAVPTTGVVTRTAMRNLMSGAKDSWVDVDGTTDPVVVCRRPAGSGTQSSYNWFNTSFPCSVAYGGYGNVKVAAAGDSYGFDNAHAGTAADPFIIDPSAGYTVIENSGSGDVRKCLQAAQLNTDYTVEGASGVFYKVLFSHAGASAANPSAVAPWKAIGVLSVDSYNKVGGGLKADGTPDGNGVGAQYDFRMLDGAGIYDVSAQAAAAGATGTAPSRTNILNGSYDFVVEPTMQFKSGTSAATDTVKSNFFTALQKKLGNPANMLTSTPATINPVPYAYAALPQLYTVDGINPISTNSREGNTCAPLHPAF